MMALMIVSVTFTACGEDDDDDVLSSEEEVVSTEDDDDNTLSSEEEEVSTEEEKEEEDDDDDDNAISSEEEVVSTSPEDNLADEAKAFVGYWENQIKKGYDWLFLGDGVCKANKYSTDPGEAGTVGYWSYDTETGILATTIASWQWYITLSNSEAWAGISVSSETSCTFENYSSSWDDCNKPYFLEFVCGTTWENASNSTLILGKNVYHYIGSSSNYTDHERGYAISGNDDVENYELIQFTSDDDYTDYTFNYTLYKAGSYKFSKGGSGTVTLSNPTSSTSAVLTFTGTLSGSYTITSF